MRAGSRANGDGGYLYVLKLKVFDVVAQVAFRSGRLCLGTKFTFAMADIVDHHGQIYDVNLHEILENIKDSFKRRRANRKEIFAAVIGDKERDSDPDEYTYMERLIVTERKRRGIN